MPKTKARPITAFPTEDLRERLDIYSRESGVPIAEITRRALNFYLEQKEDNRAARNDSRGRNRREPASRL